jgi:hypothetical protein
LAGDRRLLAAAVRAIGALDAATLGALPFAPFMVGGTILCLLWLALTSIGLLLAPAVATAAPPDTLRRERVN